MSVCKAHIYSDGHCIYCHALKSEREAAATEDEIRKAFEKAYPSFGWGDIPDLSEGKLAWDSWQAAVKWALASKTNGTGEDATEGEK